MSRGKSKRGKSEIALRVNSNSIRVANYALDKADYSDEDNFFDKDDNNYWPSSVNSELATDLLVREKLDEYREALLNTCS